jgi:hypothetical protein
MFICLVEFLAEIAQNGTRQARLGYLIFFHLTLIRDHKKGPHADQDSYRRGIEPRAAAVVGSLISKYYWRAKRVPTFYRQIQEFCTFILDTDVPIP